jgi:ATP-dependent Lon protease
MNRPSTTHESSASTGSPTSLLPADGLIIIPVRNIVLFPGHVVPLTIGRPGSVAAAQQALRDQSQVGIILQRSPEVAEPAPVDMHRLGTAANIIRYATAPDGTNHLICQASDFRLSSFLQAGLSSSPALSGFRSPMRARQRSRRASFI